MDIKLQETNNSLLRFGISYKIN